eukprot:1307105-Rhodomonas_salina.7
MRAQRDSKHARPRSWRNLSGKGVAHLFSQSRQMDLTLLTSDPESERAGCGNTHLAAIRPRLVLGIAERRRSMTGEVLPSSSRWLDATRVMLATELARRVCARDTRIVGLAVRTAPSLFSKFGLAWSERSIGLGLTSHKVMLAVRAEQPALFPLLHITHPLRVPSRPYVLEEDLRACPALLAHDDSVRSDRPWSHAAVSSAHVASK